MSVGLFKLLEPCRTLQEVADIVGVSPACVQQIEQEAFRKLRGLSLIRQLAVEASVLTQEEATRLES